MALLIIFVGLGSFGLGRLSILNSRAEAVHIVPTALNGSSEAHSVVASKTGKKYYLPWCGSVSNISEENKVWFENVEMAKAAGYTPASNCKGLN